MTSHFRSLSTLSFVLALIAVCGVNAASAQSYSGRATGIKATVITGVVPGLTTAVSDTGPLPSSGGSINAASAAANLAGILTAGASTANTSGGGTSAQSTASVASLDVNPSGITSALRVRADAVSSTTSCTCANVLCTGSSTITNLRVGEAGGGTVITVTGAANQSFTTTVGTVTLSIIINEQAGGPSSITVNALHIQLTDSATGITTDVVVASSHSDITCSPVPAFDRYSGRATGVDLGVMTLLPPSSVSTIVSDTGFLPPTGGIISVTTAGANVPGVLTTGVVTSNTSGGAPAGNADSSQSNSTVNNLNASLVGGVVISATLVQSTTQCQCGIPPTVACAGDSMIANLAVSVLGIPIQININGSTNQVIPLPGIGQLIINEQLSSGPGDVTQNALHVILNPAGLASTDLIIASSHSDIACAVSPTAAGAEIGGRVTDSNGRGVAAARVQVMSQDGEVWNAMTNQLGYYRVEHIPAGSTYIVEVTHKRFSFAPRTVSLQDSLSDVDFIAEGRNSR